MKLRRAPLVIAATVVGMAAVLSFKPHEPSVPAAVAATPPDSGSGNGSSSSSGTRTVTGDAIATRYGNVFGLGDCTTTPNSKTAAAVRAQIPVLVDNLQAVMAGKEPTAVYDGYASCPLTTSRGKVMLAEFAYGGTITPSFPLDPRKPRRSYWLLKKEFLPSLYWDKMLRGNMGPDWHAARQYPR